MHVHELLMIAVQEGASDLHVSSGEVPALRVAGRIQRFEGSPLHADEIKRLLYSIMTERQRSAFEETMEADFSIGITGLARFRVNVFQQSRGMGAVFRTIPETILTLAELDMPPVVKEIADYHQGLVLVTGPTGSGKSTTLAAMVDHINRTRAQHILTIEDPVEFIHRPNQCIINQRELGQHTRSFDAALRAAMREDPDVILVGEMRDLETIKLALTAAETGHLVFATLHTRGAIETINRIIDVFPAGAQPQIRTQLAAALRAVLSQTLLPRKQGRGRVCASEIMVMSYAIKNLIRENKVFQIPSLMQSSQGAGNRTLDSHLADLVAANRISQEVADSVTSDSALPGN